MSGLVAYGVLVQTLISLDGFGTSDATVASIRAGGSEIAAMRIGPAGDVRTADQAPGRNSAGSVVANVWYDVTLDVDTGSRMLALAVSMHDRHEVVSDQSSLRWTGLLGDGIDRVCFAPPAGVGGRSLYVSELRVTTR
ncbi:MAG: hypothetical protein M3O91_05770 [Chloroflexota bacterium]|nr:hypothetical protein [Chloroflexota bacterium]